MWVSQILFLLYTSKHRSHLGWVSTLDLHSGWPRCVVGAFVASFVDNGTPSREILQRDLTKEKLGLKWWALILPKSGFFWLCRNWNKYRNGDSIPLKEKYIPNNSKEAYKNLIEQFYQERTGTYVYISTYIVSRYSFTKLTLLYRMLKWKLKKSSKLGISVP